MSALSEKKLNEIFVASGLLVKEDIKKALEDAKERDIAIESAIADLGVITDDQAGRLVADNYGVPFVDLTKEDIDIKAITDIPEIVARSQGVFAYGWKDKTRKVAMVNPKNLEMVDWLGKRTGDELAVAYTTPRMLQEALRVYGKTIIQKLRSLVEKYESMAESGNLEGDEEISVEILDLVLDYAYDSAASDIHIEPREQTIAVRYRIDGVMHDVINLPKQMGELLVSRVKILSRLRTDEHYAAQDGKMRKRLDSETVDIRVSIVPIVDGEKVVMRLLASFGRSLTLERLGFTGEDLEKVKRAAKKSYGMLLATGPTGSGKTTTMYGVLRILNKPDVNIQTIEDPVEYDIEGVNQIQVNSKTELTFARGLRSIVRQDPDIIMVGEIRDNETAGIAVNAAMTGHLVLSTLHTNNAATTLPRLTDMDIEPFLIASSINVIIAQRLVRMICRSCILSYELEASAILTSIPKSLAEKYFGKRKRVQMYRGKGCPVCNMSGYSGRSGIFEVIEMTDNIRSLVTKQATASEIEQQAIKEGMTTMFEDGIRKALQGVTTIEEVLRVIR
ncbi:TPA: hypothetical protein DCZ32_02840 [Candidatus Uhrbacteria bacterium]|nr:hypothetical protein [Candidatus Uhrbacteria bacterium]